MYVNIQDIQKMFLLFEQSKKLTLLQYTDYDILLEIIKDVDCWDYAYNALISIRVKHSKDIGYTLSKISEHMYSYYQVSYFEDKLQISCLLDVKKINVDVLIQHIQCMLKII